MYKERMTWPRVVSFGLVSHWRWHMQKEEGLAQGNPLGGTKSQTLPAGRGPAVQLRLKLGPGSFPPTESSCGGTGLGFQPRLWWWGGTMTDAGWSGSDLWESSHPIPPTSRRGSLQTEIQRSPEWKGNAVKRSRDRLD